jgi:hypothetical protein
MLRWIAGNDLPVNPTSDIDHVPLQGPPRWLIITIVGGVVFIVGAAIAGLLIFQNVLRPGQQQRVIDAVPFMGAFLPSRGNGNNRIPTAIPDPNNSLSPEDLLDILLSTSTPAPTIPPSATVSITPSPSPSATTTVSVVTPSISPSVIPQEIASTATDPAALQLPSNARIYGLRGVIQTWNNCGPATITMGLSYFGWTEEQTYAASFLKPDAEDKNVTPGEMVNFVNQQTGVRAITRMAGNIDLIRAYIAGGFPVIVSIGYAPEGEDWLGHYRAIVGYDDARQEFFAYDSYLGTGINGEGITISYRELDSVWQQFNRRFIVLYETQNEERVAQILGQRVDPIRAAELAVEIAQDEVETDPRNGFAWFNLGTSLLALERYEEAAIAYDRARQLDLPWRMLWYQFGPYEAYFQVGRYSDVIALVNANLNNGGAYVEETYYWQGQVFSAEGNTADALISFNRAIQANPLYDAAQEAITLLSGAQ